MKLLTVAIILAHSWYHPYCCNNRDCKPVKPGTVTVTPEGYSIDGETVYTHSDRIKQSRDGQFHVCRNLKTKHIRCIYVPQTGV